MVGAIYLTGIAGVGKSTVLSELERSTTLGLKVFSYSEHLGRHLGKTREELRAESSVAVAKVAVQAVDGQLADYVRENRSASLVVIDSHAVTDEDFGNRVIPFEAEVLESLSLDAIFCLVASPETIASRVVSNPKGRQRRSIDQIARAQAMQVSVAVSYSVALGVPLYSIDAEAGPVELAQTMERAMLRATRV